MKQIDPKKYDFLVKLTQYLEMMPSNGMNQLAKAEIVKNAIAINAKKEKDSSEQEVLTIKIWLFLLQDIGLMPKNLSYELLKDLENLPNN